jgi:biopolymer transport protein ExbD
VKISGRRDYTVSLESVAMTDIILNMFIFFFISFSLLYTFNSNRLHKLGVDIPKAKTAKPVDEARVINISVAKNGIIYFEKEAVTLDELIDAIEVSKAKNSTVRILLQADQAAAFKDVAKVLDVLNGLQVQNIGIAVEATR